MGLGDRICFRLKARFPIRYKDPKDTLWTKAFSTDLSTSGMGILTRQPLGNDSGIDLQFRIPGCLRKIILRACVVHQIPAQGKNNKFLATGIRFEEIPEKDLHALTGFILKKLRMAGIRTFVLLTGLIAFAAVLFRSLYYSILGIFQRTSFGKEWLQGIWESFPSDRIAYYYAAMAVLILISCFCFFCMKKNASLGILLMATVGLLDQGIRCALKIPYLTEDLPSAWILLAETALMVLWGSLVWAMIRHGRDYEETLELMHEDAGFKPASPERPPKEMPPPANHVFLP